MMLVNIMNPEQTAKIVSEYDQEIPQSQNADNSCNGLTLLERKIPNSTSALETKIIFNQLSLTAEKRRITFICTLLF